MSFVFPSKALIILKFVFYYFSCSASYLVQRRTVIIILSIIVIQFSFLVLVVRCSHSPNPYSHPFKELLKLIALRKLLYMPQ
jgi:hypothetical protein